MICIRTHNTRVVSSKPARVTMKTSLARNATGNHIIKFTSLEKLRVLSSASATLKVEYTTLCLNPDFGYFFKVLMSFLFSL